MTDKQEAMLKAIETDLDEQYNLWVNDGCDTADAIDFITDIQIRVRAVIDRALSPVVNAQPTADAATVEALERLREALDWALNEIRATTRYDNEQQFWNCYDRARAALEAKP